MKNIHIVCKAQEKNPPKPIERGSDTFRSESWKIPESAQSDIIGGKVFFHQGQQEPSYFGGTVIRLEDVGDRQAVIFDRDPTCNGVKSLGGWSYEMKIVEV